MGGGDLNTKKAWHPSTLKNQERVWKAEQAAAEEQKRILELQRERAQERDREELNKLARQNPDAAGASDNRLSWMYDQKPDKKVQQEDYLLGKAIDKNYDNAGKAEQNEIPAVSRRVVGSSMITASGDAQVDLVRKLREDPLLLVKERERAARAALLNNPVQRRKLTELLRKEQEQKHQTKSEKKSKKKDIDDLLAAKLNALGGEKGMNIAKLLASDDSSSEDSSEEEKSKKKKKKKKKKHKSKKRKQDSDSESPIRSKKSKESKSKTKKHHDDSETESFAAKTSKNSYKHESQNRTLHTNTKSSRSDNYENKDMKEYSRRSRSPNRYHQQRHRDSSTKRNSSSKDTCFENRKRDKEGNQNRRTGLSEEEKTARLAEMAAAGAEREIQRGQRVAAQLAENAAEAKSMPRQSSRNEARVLPDSLESRIHSNRHYIQRDKRHMNEHFARR